MLKFATGLLVALVLVIAIPATAWAHVVVTPNEAVVGARTTFNVSVPNEKESAVTGLRLSVPDGLEGVTPTVHAGWTISTTKADNGKVSEIRWEGGSIPAGQRDDFTFRAQTPASETSLVWKAYQSYADGSTVAWDQEPSAEEGHGEEESDSGPYSVTKVVDDLASDEDTATGTDGGSQSIWPLALSLLALVVSAFALVRGRSQPTDSGNSSK